MIEDIHPKSEKKVCRICLSGSKRLWKQVGWSVNQTFEPANQGCGNTLQRIFLGFTLQTKFLFYILRCQSRVWQKIKNNLWVFLSSYPTFRIFDWKVEHLKDRIEGRTREDSWCPWLACCTFQEQERSMWGEVREGKQGRAERQSRRNIPGYDDSSSSWNDTAWFLASFLKGSSGKYVMMAQKSYFI